mmetsp:Transcript_29498/g.68003  ORF Transcript_29498/g.68003 Transcript_29498/m.68003 type:complete len:549 (+) Transcript_29498:148-1794(+)
MGCGALVRGASLSGDRYVERSGTQKTASTDSPTSPRSPVTAPVPKAQKNKEEEEEEAKIQIMRDIYIFRHLALTQLEHLVRHVELHTYKKGESIVAQNEIGHEFFVVAEGEVVVRIDDNIVRHLGKNAYFGERALLFDEPRSATIEVASSVAECWAVAKATFLASVTEKMHQQLLYRIRLQDTNIVMQDLQTLKCIGAGAMGSVELVIHKKTHTHYALKKVAKEDGEVPARCLSEVHLLAMNDHPFVLHLVTTFETEAEMCMLTELVTGGELFAAIRAFPNHLSRRDAQFYIGSLTLALEALHHRRILYRDLKPENILLDAQGYLKIIDFGVAMKMETKHRTFTVIGTPHYMAPEIIKGRGYGLLVDIWAMGVILYEMVCGFLPFGNEVEIPQDVFKAIMQSTLKFSDSYADQAGKALIKALLHPNTKERLGVGGYHELKQDPWFEATSLDICECRSMTSLTSQDWRHAPTLFDHLLARELDAPLIPDVSDQLEDEEESTSLGMALVEPKDSRLSHYRVSLSLHDHRSRMLGLQSHATLDTTLEATPE